MRDCCILDGNAWFRYRTAAIIIEDGKLLLAGSPGVDYLYTVGGAVHIGESAEEGVKRETLEETGVPYEIDRPALIVENFFYGKGGNLDGLKCHCIEFYFLMKSRGSTDVSCTSTNWDNEPETLHWAALSDLADTNVKPEFLKTALPEVLKTGRLIHLKNSYEHPDVFTE